MQNDAATSPEKKATADTSGRNATNGDKHAVEKAVATKAKAKRGRPRKKKETENPPPEKERENITVKQKSRKEPQDNTEDASDLSSSPFEAPASVKKRNRISDVDSLNLSPISTISGKRKAAAHVNDKENNGVSAKKGLPRSSKKRAKASMESTKNFMEVASPTASIVCEGGDEHEQELDLDSSSFGEIEATSHHGGSKNPAQENATVNRKKAQMIPPPSSKAKTQAGRSSSRLAQRVGSKRKLFNKWVFCCCYRR